MRSYLWLILFIFLPVNLFAAVSQPINQGGGGGGLITDITAPLIVTSGNLSIPSATSGRNGYLLSTDWSTFNGKQAAGNYLTALTGDVVASGPGSAPSTIPSTIVSGKILTGFSSAAGAVSASDSILVAFNKVVGNIALKANSGANSDITSLSGLTTPLSIAQGGTGQTTAANARNALLPDQSGHSGNVLTTDGSAATWQAAAGGGGVDTVGTFSASAQTNGASISSTTITFGPASATVPGMVGTGSQTWAGTKTFSSLPAFTGGGDLLMSGGSGVRLKRANSGISISDTDVYTASPGIDFYGGSMTLLAELDANQFILSSPFNMYPSGTLDIGGTYLPRNISGTGVINAGSYLVSGIGPIFKGLQYTTSTSTQTLAANTHGIILDPASTTASQTVTLPTSGNSADGEVLKISCGANGVTALTIGAGSGTTVVGGASRACIATSFGFIYRGANTTWYPY